MFKIILPRFCINYPVYMRNKLQSKMAINVLLYKFNFFFRNLNKFNYKNTFLN